MVRTPKPTLKIYTGIQDVDCCLHTHKLRNKKTISTIVNECWECIFADIEEELCSVLCKTIDLDSDACFLFISTNSSSVEGGPALSKNIG